jgi:hypothetical protein
MRLGDPRTTQELRGSSRGDMEPPTITVRAEDREVRGAPRGGTQRGMGFGSATEGSHSMTNADTHQFITYRPRDVNQWGTGSAQDSATMRNITGTVDMQAYLDWLRNNGYTFAGAN